MEATYTPRLRKQYKDEVVPALMKKFRIQNCNAGSSSWRRYVLTKVLKVL